jgi:hypothetical protein
MRRFGNRERVGCSGDLVGRIAAPALDNVFVNRPAALSR